MWGICSMPIFISVGCECVDSEALSVCMCAFACVLGMYSVGGWVGVLYVSMYACLLKSGSQTEGLCSRGFEKLTSVSLKYLWTLQLYTCLKLPSASTVPALTQTYSTDLQRGAGRERNGSFFYYPNCQKK